MLCTESVSNPIRLELCHLVFHVVGAQLVFIERQHGKVETHLTLRFGSTTY